MIANRARTTVLSVAVGTFLYSLDTNAVTLALPLIQKAFHASITSVAWVLIGYLLTITATLFLFGRVGDAWGHKKTYNLGLAIFTLGSLVCALSASLTTLILSVVVQGVGASMMMASTNALIIGSVPEKDRGKAMGASALAVALAACIGPSLGGLLAASLGWRSIFLLNVPVGIVGFLLVAKNVDPDGPRQEAFHNETRNTGSLSKNPAFFFGVSAAFFFYCSQFILVFLAPFYLQTTLGLNPSQAGLMMLPLAISLILVAPISGSISDRLGSRGLSVVGMVFLALGAVLISSFTSQTALILVGVGFAICGVGVGLFQVPNNSAIMGSVSKEHHGLAGAILATGRNLGMFAGEAIAAFFMGSRELSSFPLACLSAAVSALLAMALVLGKRTSDPR